MSHDPKDPQLISKMGADPEVQSLTNRWFNKVTEYRYSYNFTWLGRPIIQFPQDIVALQELIWSIKPRAIVETGIAHGGSLIFSSSMLELIGNDGIVVGVDIDIRQHNRVEIEAHHMYHRIKMLQGSSIDQQIVDQVRTIVADRSPVLVILDSNHTHEHVLKELELYSSLVQSGSYLLVFDTVVEFTTGNAVADRPWGIGNSPYTAVQEFLKTTDRFVIDKEIEDKLQVTVAPGGWLKCVKDS